MPKYSRQCPICNKQLSYAHASSFSAAKKGDKPCLSCGRRKNAMSFEKIQSMKEMIMDGKFQDEILQELNITNSQYKYVITKFKLKSNKRSSIKIVDKVNKLAQCSKCNDIISLDGNFPLKTKKSGYQYYWTYCYDCHYKKRNAHLSNDRNAFLGEAFSALRSTSKTKKIPFTISKEEFILQYNNQNGKCFYTDLEMVCRAGEGTHRYAMSVDKIVPEKGYVLGNVVFCCYKINTCKLDLTLDEMKEWMPKWHSRIMEFFKCL